MKFCSNCGQSVGLKVPPGDNRPRFVCDHCGVIHYQNPKIVTGCIPEYQGRILLCKRAIEPKYGLWTLPAGFMENGESNRQGAARETREEACAELAKLQLFSVFSISHVDQIYTMYRGEVIDGKADAGAESLEVAFVDEADIPWGEIAFKVVEENLKLYLADRARGRFEVHYGEIDKVGENRYTVRY